MYRITATFTNTSADRFFDLYFEVTALTGGNVLFNRDGAPSSVPAAAGAKRSVPNAGLPGGDGELDPGESFTVVFEIGLAVRARFTFFVDAWGVAAP